METEPSAALMSAIVTEHFVLQSGAGTTVSEALGRSSLYLSALSSSLIALGFAAQTPGLLLPFAAAALPTVFVLGVFTMVRLVGTGVQNMLYLSGISRIRGYYRTLDPEAARYFARWGAGDGETDDALGSLAVRGGPMAGLFTAASMIAVINGVLAGVGLALLTYYVVTDHHLPAALAVGLVAMTAGLAMFFRYQHRCYLRVQR
ncbi:hypothetical protein SAMN05444920_12833 [Nonomuraea solani]|uniref:Uncharacterized protein n=1 Tax=Nonomuraea solani TaxID=1144553 RepID=A0A1H6F067_9ACTN|nr:hypothetical protein [Nonomuraea solani]SEH02606.1 hypothetical protein SAMN05444920_12833 [Nonomuraea solani]